MIRWKVLGLLTRPEAQHERMEDWHLKGMRELLDVYNVSDWYASVCEGYSSSRCRFDRSEPGTFIIRTGNAVFKVRQTASKSKWSAVLFHPKSPGPRQENSRKSASSRGS